MNARFQAIEGYVKMAMTLGALGIMTLSGVAVARTGGICKLPSAAYTILTPPPAANPPYKYALCAGATSFIFNEITYAKCTIEGGSSISEPLKYPDPPNPDIPMGDITTFYNTGNANGVSYPSTYSPPANATVPGGNLAVYTCNKARYNP
ncbi:MAG: hypothetical protein ACREEZ_03800, partial [Stellaceae bacterium]